VRKICVITGTRAEYGQLRWLMEGIQNSSELDLQVCVTGMHLSPEFGLTYREIEADGFPIDCKVEMLLSSDTSVGVSKSMGLGLIGFADAFHSLKPDLVLILGDRYEIFAAGAAATLARIPIAHLHGGEATEGLIDEPIRHSLTKMSHLHFVAAEEYRDRVIQLGENPGRVFCVGGLGIDNILKIDLLERGDLEESLNFSLGEKSILVTFHPVTLEQNTSSEQMKELLAALEEFEDTNFIFTMPNSDMDGRLLFDLIERFVSRSSNSIAFTSLGQLRYLSCIKHVDAVVGNSSSGLTEVPSFKKPTINIGDRQRGRLKAVSVIDCRPEKLAISNAIRTAFAPSFQEKLKTVKNPYGSGGASERIVQKLEVEDFSGILKKEFHDISLG
jgi:GDP/UDP-N,N'-diacetylbacillosamine 2-epimerase (hydrolysing)